MPQQQPKPSTNGHRDVIFGVYDRLYDHGHCVPNVVLVPATAEGEPDWDNAGLPNISSLPAAEWPEDPKPCRGPQF